MTNFTGSFPPGCSIGLELQSKDASLTTNTLLPDLNGSELK